MKQYRYEILVDGEVTDRMTCGSVDELKKCIDILTQFSEKEDEPLQTPGRRNASRIRQFLEGKGEVSENYLKKEMEYELNKKDVEEALKLLKKRGNVFFPKHGFVKTTREVSIH